MCFVSFKVLDQLYIYCPQWRINVQHLDKKYKFCRLFKICYIAPITEEIMTISFSSFSWMFLVLNTNTECFFFRSEFS